MFFRRSCLAALALAVFALAGCGSDSKKPSEPEVPVAPQPTSPQKLVDLVAWCWEQKDAALYREVFAANYAYQFAPADSVALSVTLDRDDELDIGENLFRDGLPGHPAAASITFNVDEFPTVANDDRPGRNGRWHKLVITSVRLIVGTSGLDYSTSGTARFYVTRGDSAQIPADLVARGFTPDSTRWYLDFWSDETSCSKRCVTVGTVKQDYRTPPASIARAASSRTR